MLPAPIVCAGMLAEGVFCGEAVKDILPVWVSPPDERYAIWKLKVLVCEIVRIPTTQFPRCSKVGTAN